MSDQLTITDVTLPRQNDWVKTQMT